MGFELKAVIGQDADLREWKRIFPSLVLCRLSGELRLVPLTYMLAVEMRAWLAAGGAPLRPGSTENQVAETWLADASLRARLVYVDAFEFGEYGARGLHYLGRRKADRDDGLPYTRARVIPGAGRDQPGTGVLH